MPTNDGTRIVLHFPFEKYIYLLLKFTINKAYAETLRQKMWRFEDITKTKKQVTWVFMSTYGLQENEYSLELIYQSLTLDDLF